MQVKVVPKREGLVDRVADATNEFRDEASLREADEIQDAYKEVFTNISVVTALIGGFALSFAVAEIEIQNSVKENNIWSSDAFGKEVWQFVLAMTIVTCFLTCFLCNDQTQQFSQCPTSCFKEYFVGIGQMNVVPFVLLGVCYFWLFLALGVLFSLVLRTVLFLIATGFLLLGIILMAKFHMIPLLNQRLQLISAKLEEKEEQAAHELPTCQTAAAAE